MEKRVNRIFIVINNESKIAKEFLVLLDNLGIKINGDEEIEDYIYQRIDTMKYLVVDEMGYINICRIENPKDFLDDNHQDTYVVVSSKHELEMELKNAKLID